MDEKEMAVKLAEHHKEIGSLKHRMIAVESETKAINNLAMSVEKLAISVEGMAKEQAKHGEKIAKLESQPAERWGTMTGTIFTTVVATMSGALITYIITMLMR